MSMTRSAERKPDAMLYTVEGSAGAIQFIYWTASQTAGPVGIHSRQPAGSHPPGPCDVLSEGECYCDPGFRAGVEAAEILRNGGDDALFAYLEDWYASRLTDGSSPREDHQP